MTAFDKRTLLALTLMFLLGIVAWFFHEEYLQLLLGYFEDVKFETTAISGLPNTLIFCWALGILPILIFGSNLFARNKKFTKKLITATITLLTGFVFVFARMLYINSFTGADLRIPGIHLSITLESLDTEYYLGSGFIVGAILSTFLFVFISKQR